MKLASVMAMLASLASSVMADSTFTPIKPPSQPLAVRSPYLSAWQAAGSGGGNGGYLAGQWPSFWNDRTLGWEGLIRVDGTAYQWMGAMGGGPDLVNQTAYEYTATRSIYTMNIENAVQMTITFLSPITPDDWKRQSLVFSYMEVEVVSIDGREHDVQIYSDISAEWISGDDANIAEWSYGNAGDNVVYHQIYRQTQQAWSEVSDQTEFGYWYWATSDQNGYSYQNGQDIVVRNQFINDGYLANTQDTNYRAISDDWPIFAHAFDLGKVGGWPVSRLWSIGLCQDEPIQYTEKAGELPQSSYYLNYFSSHDEVVSFFQNDYDVASWLSSELDGKLQIDSLIANGQNYATLTTLGLRQAFGCLQFTGTIDSPLVWLKEISSDGNMNTVDVIFPAHPAYVYTNATILKLLMEPLLINQASGLYPNTYSMHDIGSHYPNATGYPLGNDEDMPLEECGNMLLMGLMYYAVTKDETFLKTYYDLWTQWTGYLVEESLIPANQISTDDFEGALPNQTNLAIKGIAGIQAMSYIANITGNPTEGANYTNIAQSYIPQWIDYANDTTANPPHFELNYNNESTWSILYNMFPDAAMNLGIVPESVYEEQEAWYPHAIISEYGLPVDTRHNWSKTDWEIWGAATCKGDTRQTIIDHVATFAAQTPQWMPFGDLYETLTAEYTGAVFINRPVQGGMLAVLVANMGITV